MNTPDLEVYNKSMRLIGEKSPIIRQIGNGIGARLDAEWNIIHPTLDQRLNLINGEPQAEMHTVNGGTFEFRTPHGGTTFYNPVDFNRDYLTRCREKGIGIEIEVYDLSHIANIVELLEEGVVEMPLHFSVVLGIMGGAQATPENLVHMVNQLPEGSSWQVVTVGKYHVRTTAMAMAMGGNVRTGLEDTIYYTKGELAKNNAALVERMVRLAREMGREPATIEEARSMLGIG